MRTGRRAPQGVVLLEVLVALVLLGVTGAAVAAMATGSSDAVRRARRSDAEVSAASAFLDNVVLWTVDDLDRHLGTHAQGDWRLEVQRPVATLYTVSLFDSTGTRLLLRTAVYRADSSLAEPPSAR